jgi:hypothetical protein
VNNSAGVQIFHENWNGGSYGDGSWADDARLGTASALYMEDNTYQSNGSKNGVVDAVGGTHYVFRMNQVHDDILVAHGTESSGRSRGTRAVEVYGNTLTCGSGYCENELRSGTAVIYGNTLTGNWGGVYMLKEYRLGAALGGWPQDPSVWDGDTDAYGYPCLDQVGRGKGDLLSGAAATPVGWPHQQAEPVYGWNNRLNGALGRIASGGVWSNGISLGTVILEHRDYFNDTMRPGYVPYVYPHPLAR